MTKDRRDQLLIEVDSRIDKLQKIEDLLKGLKNPEKCPGSIRVYGAAIDITINTMEELHEVRTFLREEFGTWEDKLTNIFASYEAYAIWSGRVRDILIKIYLSCPIKDFPEELRRDGCHFEKRTREETVFVCDKEAT